MGERFRTNLVNEIRKIVDSSSDKRNIGKVKTDSSPKAFSFRSLNIAKNPNDIKSINSLTWIKKEYQHDRGLFYRFNGPNSDFNNVNSQITGTYVTATTGNFFDSEFTSNINVMYLTSLDAVQNTSVPLNITASQCSLAIYISYGKNSSPVEVFNSGDKSFFVSGRHSLNLLKGTNRIYILYYRQRSGGSLKIQGDLSSYGSNTAKRADINRKKVNPSNIKTEFLDSRFQPTLSNIIEIPKQSIDGSSGEGDISHFRVYREEINNIGIISISGWGNNSFTVQGNKVDYFPVAGTAIFETETGTTNVISGARYLSGIDQTVIGISGTLSGNVAGTNIYLSDFSHKFDIKQTNFQTISGIDTDIIAGINYKYRISPISITGDEGEKSDVFSISTGDFSSPDPVTNLSVSGSFRKVLINWTNPINKDLKGIHFWDRQNPNSVVLLKDGFEETFVDPEWSDSGSITLFQTSTEQSKVENRSLKITGGFAANDNSFVFRTFQTTVGKRYKIVGWVYVSPGSDPSKAGLGILDPDLFEIPQRIRRPMSTGKWEYIDLPLSKPCTSSDTQSVILIPGANSTVYFDQIVVAEVDDPISIHPIAEINKGSYEVFKPLSSLSFVIDRINDNILFDNTPYSFYLSTYDWAGNESFIEMPSGVGTTIPLITKEIFLKEVSTPTTPNNAGGIFVSDGSGGLNQGEVYVIDDNDNTTLISPHDMDGNWIFYSKNTNNGKVFKVHMEKLMKALNSMLGGDFVEEYYE